MDPDDRTVALDAISARRERWVRAINAGSADSFVAAVAPDAVWLPSRQAAIEGADRIREWLSDPFSQYEYDYAIKDIRVRLAGNWAIENARFRTRAVDRSGVEAPLHEGEYTILWKRSPGEGWLIDRYIDHSGEIDN